MNTIQLFTNIKIAITFNYALCCVQIAFVGNLKKSNSKAYN